MTKIISLSDDAYEMLSNLKEEGESFSEVVRKLAKDRKKYDFMDFAGVLKEEREEWKNISKEITKNRKKIKPRFD